MVRLGDLDLEDGVNDGASPVDMEVESAMPHSEYKSSEKVNDIAIVKLRGRVQFTGNNPYLTFYIFYYYSQSNKSNQIKVG